MALLSLTAANMGLTLSAADLVVFAELFWNPGVCVLGDQRLDALWRAETVGLGRRCNGQGTFSRVFLSFFSLMAACLCTPRCLGLKQ